MGEVKSGGMGTGSGPHHLTKPINRLSSPSLSYYYAIDPAVVLQSRPVHGGFHSPAPAFLACHFAQGNVAPTSWERLHAAAAAAPLWETHRQTAAHLGGSHVWPTADSFSARPCGFEDQVRLAVTWLRVCCHLPVRLLLSALCGIFSPLATLLLFCDLTLRQSEAMVQDLGGADPSRGGTPS